MRKSCLIGVLLLVVVLLGGCGQKGDLFLPDDQSENAS
ncbi:LPS translocon maturation chaperone LptM [Natronocella acetinitrilica]